MIGNVIPCSTWGCVMESEIAALFAELVNAVDNAMC